MVNWLIFLFRILDLHMLHVKSEIKKYGNSLVFFIQLLNHVLIPPFCSLLTSARKKILLILFSSKNLNGNCLVFLIVESLFLKLTYSCDKICIFSNLNCMNSTFHTQITYFETYSS